ncbi:hypothetical protein DIPPA_12348 [Diplonema papillatum]|nr:hypothetical protein DIPPA_12348 [Diplonema papillatum]
MPPTPPMQWAIGLQMSNIDGNSGIDAHARRARPAREDRSPHRRTGSEAAQPAARAGARLPELDCLWVAVSLGGGSMSLASTRQAAGGAGGTLCAGCTGMVVEHWCTDAWVYRLPRKDALVKRKRAAAALREAESLLCKWRACNPASNAGRGASGAEGQASSAEAAELDADSLVQQLHQLVVSQADAMSILEENLSETRKANANLTRALRNTLKPNSSAPSYPTAINRRSQSLSNARQLRDALYRDARHATKAPADGFSQSTPQARPTATSAPSPLGTPAPSAPPAEPASRDQAALQRARSVPRPSVSTFLPKEAPGCGALPAAGSLHLHQSAAPRAAFRPNSRRSVSVPGRGLGKGAASRGREEPAGALQRPVMQPGEHAARPPGTAGAFAGESSEAAPETRRTRPAATSTPLQRPMVQPPKHTTKPSGTDAPADDFSKSAPQTPQTRSATASTPSPASVRQQPMLQSPKHTTKHSGTAAPADESSIPAPQTPRNRSASASTPSPASARQQPMLQSPKHTTKPSGTAAPADESSIPAPRTPRNRSASASTPSPRAARAPPASGAASAVPPSVLAMDGIWQLPATRGRRRSGATETPPSENKLGGPAASAVGAADSAERALRPAAGLRQEPSVSLPSDEAVDPFSPSATRGPPPGAPPDNPAASAEQALRPPTGRRREPSADTGLPSDEAGDPFSPSAADNRRGGASVRRSRSAEKLAAKRRRLLVRAGSIDDPDSRKRRGLPASGCRRQSPQPASAESPAAHAETTDAPADASRSPFPRVRSGGRRDPTPPSTPGMEDSPARTQPPQHGKVSSLTPPSTPGMEGAQPPQHGKVSRKADERVVAVRVGALRCVGPPGPAGGGSMRGIAPKLSALEAALPVGDWDRAVAGEVMALLDGIRADADRLETSLGRAEDNLRCVKKCIVEAPRRRAVSVPPAAHSDFSQRLLAVKQKAYSHDLAARVEAAYHALAARCVELRMSHADFLGSVANNRGTPPPTDDGLLSLPQWKDWFDSLVSAGQPPEAVLDDVLKHICSTSKHVRFSSTGHDPT